MKKIISVILIVLMRASSAFAVAEIATEETIDQQRLDSYIASLFADVTPDEYALEIAGELFGYSLRIDEVESKVTDAISANKADIKLLRSIDDECETIDNDMDACEDSLEASRRSKSISNDVFYILDDELERFDDRLDKIDDRLERFFDYDD